MCDVHSGWKRPVKLMLLAFIETGCNGFFSVLSLCLSQPCTMGAQSMPPVDLATCAASPVVEAGGVTQNHLYLRF